MGTITVGINIEDLNMDAEYCPSSQLEKFLIEVNPKLNHKARDEVKLDKANFFLSKIGYKKNTYGFIEVDRMKFIHMSSEPEIFFQKLYDFKITWHQSEWDSQKQVVETFVSIFGKENAEAILCRGKVLRFDAWVDTEIPYEKLRKTIYRPGITITDQMKRRNRSYYFGSRKPKHALFYEKHSSKIKFMDIRSKGEIRPERCTRIEMRFFDEMVPIRTYADYHKSAEFDVAHMLKCFYYSRAMIEEIVQDHKTLSKKIATFLYLVDLEGIHFARESFNENRDFYRTIEPVLQAASKDLRLSEKWKVKVREEIIGDFDIRSFFNQDPS